MAKVIIVIDQPDDQKMTREEFAEFDKQIRRLLPNVSQTACIKDTDTIDIRRAE